MSMNKVFIMGVIVSKELKVANERTSFLKFTVRVWEKDKTEFLDCVAYNDLAFAINREFEIKDTIFLEASAHTYFDQDRNKLTHFKILKYKNYNLKNYAS